MGKKKAVVFASLELKLRRCQGTALQEFFSNLMDKVHGGNFVAVGSAYSQGDLSCDGMLKVPFTIFACYGPVNAGANATQAAMKTAVTKVGSDFAGALAKWADLKAWVFVHNYMGVPPQIVHALMELEKNNPKQSISQFGKERFQDAILLLDQENIEELLGNSVTDEDFRSMVPSVVLEVVDSLMGQPVPPLSLDDEPIIVPGEKLLFNGLAQVYKNRIVDGLQNAKTVARILSDHPNPMLDSDVASAFKEKYLDLKNQGFKPDDIMSELYEFALAGHKARAEREVAVWSLLAHLFEKCTIFEDKPVAVMA